MQFPESWVREFCNPDLSTAELARVLTMAGLEVEEIHPAAPPFSHIVVAEILEAQPHPDADRLRVCRVNAGPGHEELKIVCGAPNARAGIRVSCAVIGAELPPGADGKPFVIKKTKLRGVESQGMLCSARELGLSEDHSGLMELPADAPVGQDVRQYLQLNDAVLTLKLTPNLAHCLSVYGVAREVSAITGAPLKTPQIAPVARTGQRKLPVNVLAPDLCGRFSGCVIEGVNPRAQTPQWMVQRLARCGQRSVSALVDISNYVMFEYGQPTHIFDLDKIHGALQVRWGHPGERLELLNGNTVTVDERVGVIADERQVESLSGIMGGQATAVNDDTRNIYAEAAFWWPKAIAGRARRFNFSTDAAHRFERGVDPAQTVRALERITQLIVDICGGQPSAVDDQPVNLPAQRSVGMRISRAARVTGMPLTAQQCVDALQRQHLPLAHDGDVITVQVPSFRFDLEIEEDLIEEVARMVGYGNLPSTPVLAPAAASVRSESRRGAFAVRHALAALGYLETINFSFVPQQLEEELAGNAEPVRLLNPIASQMNVMRSTLLGSLLQAVRHNLDRKASRVRIFEVGRVFLRAPAVQADNLNVQGFLQPLRVAGMAVGTASELQWSESARRVDFFDIKGDVQALLSPLNPVFEAATHPAMHPGRCARVLLEGKQAGFVGELHPRWQQQWELAGPCVMFELDLEAVLQRPMPQPQPVPRHQPLERDIAVVVAGEVTSASIQEAIRAAAAPSALLREVVLFDVFRPAAGSNSGLAQGEKSMALRLVFNRAGDAPAEDELEGVMSAIIERLAQSCGARLRA